jgi:ubiquinone/menaquinone biosynthesis C-methylase UbiE
MKKRPRRWILSQFHHPRGLAGRLVGWEMTLRPSNRKRNVWAVSLMDVQPSDRVLEIGFGPGIAVRELARRATRGLVVGIDHSEAMRAQAARRNAAAIGAGRVSLMVAAVDDQPAFDRPFDKILAANNMGMWPEPAVRLKELGGLLRPGGLIAIVSQPRTPGATAETTAANAREIAGLLDAAGFTAIRAETLDLKPPVACVMGTTPSAPASSSTSGNREGAA